MKPFVKIRGIFFTEAFKLMARNKALQDAAKARQDKFYTDIHDIEYELMYYSLELFYDKVALCDCDAPY